LTNECIWLEDEEETPQNHSKNGKSHSSHLDVSYPMSLPEMDGLQAETDKDGIYSNAAQGSFGLKTGINDPSLSVLDRSSIMLQSKQTKILKIQQEKLQKEMEDLNIQPQINKKSKVLIPQRRTVEDMMKWENERKQRLQSQITARNQQETKEVTGKPMISKKAEELSRRWEQEQQEAEEEVEPYFDQPESREEREREDDGSTSYQRGSGGRSVKSTASSNSNVVNRLYEFEERKRLKLQRIKEEEEWKARHLSIPKIAPHSTKILQQRQQDYYYGGGGFSGENASFSSPTSAASATIYDRLAYQQQREREEESAFPSFSATSAALQHDEHTGQRLFEPSINPTSERLASRNRPSNLPIEEILQQKGKQYQQRIAEKEKKLNFQSKQLSSTPKVNSNSAKLMEERALSYGETSKDRLTRPIGSVKYETIEEMNRSLTFKPKINENSTSMAHIIGNGGSGGAGGGENGSNSFYYHNSRYYEDAAGGKGGATMNGKNKASASTGISLFLLLFLSSLIFLLCILRVSFFISFLFPPFSSYGSFLDLFHLYVRV
jgi:hypothetical protein